jgi:hypothetical protein
MPVLPERLLVYSARHGETVRCCAPRRQHLRLGEPQRHRSERRLAVALGEQAHHRREAKLSAASLCPSLVDAWRQAALS